ncbi:hypothetical protein ACFWYW_59295, partial [Nonomuraea sp. NPDC059023]|uniref:hypothetical protein n=1 Tax=unclassified Nonomuraea TaxID=2593643 RepID=UPI0036855CB9
MRILKSALISFVVLLGLGLGTAPASAADIPDLQIGTIGYNAYGADTMLNRNSEYVDVKNVGAAGVPVAGLLLQDSWARGNNRTTRCNTYTLQAGVLPVDAGATADVLPAGRTLRIYMGAGTPRVFVRNGVTYHAVFANSPDRCGYHGHIWNNGKSSSSSFAAWDTAWITLGSVSESKGYNFSFGYTAS